MKYFQPRSMVEFFLQQAVDRLEPPRLSFSSCQTPKCLIDDGTILTPWAIQNDVQSNISSMEDETRSELIGMDILLKRYNKIWSNFKNHINITYWFSHSFFDQIHKSTSALFHTDVSLASLSLYLSFSLSLSLFVYLSHSLSTSLFFPFLPDYLSLPQPLTLFLFQHLSFICFTTKWKKSVWSLKAIFIF